jgi:hypothetical protein
MNHLKGGAFCVAHRALLNVEFVTASCNLVARIDLSGLRWNAPPMRLTFSSEIRIFSGDFIRNRLLQFVVPVPMFFRIGGFRPYCILNRGWTAARDCNSASQNTHWTCSCDVNIVTELAEGHQLAHGHKPDMKKKNFQSFPFRWHKPYTCMKISLRDIIFYFGYLSSEHSVHLTISMLYYSRHITQKNNLNLKLKFRN